MSTDRPDRPERRGRVSVFWVAIWLIFLVEPVKESWDARGTAAGWAGLAILLAFAVVYVVTFARFRMGIRARTRPAIRQALPLLLVMLALSVLACIVIGESATASGVYVSVMCVVMLPRRVGVVLGLALAVGYYLAGFLVPGWDPEPNLLLSGLAATIAVFGVLEMMRANAELRAANEENQRLAVLEERHRFARDLHDILGHSLSVITVKAQLARKLLARDPAQAAVELTDLERLSRDALADVRRTVEGYRELTLPGEVSRARIALRAAEIEPDLPNSTEQVPTDLRPLFAWAIREGITNVIRHSGATRCVVRLGPDRVRIDDDGAGPGVDGGSGHGLTGLRERAAAAGATVVTGPSVLGGYALEVIA